jgi:hypothetical protein
MIKRQILLVSILIFLIACDETNEYSSGGDLEPTSDDNKWLILNQSDLPNSPHHTRHAEIFGQYVSGYNCYILEGIDIVQSTAPDGGGYFTGITADPPEAPIGYDLTLFGSQLLDLERRTSYCSGSTYSAFIEAMNLIYHGSDRILSEERIEALRMQEPDGGRREDDVKFWGKWNDDGYGNHFALVQYSGMGEIVEPSQARPGDFMNISWKNGGGHSVIFLGWFYDETGMANAYYWASQKSTNGLGDSHAPIDTIAEILVVRLMRPDKIFEFDPARETSDKVKGTPIRPIDFGILAREE